ncbi:pilus assembly PilX family protein [endosymbiont of Ridgeia piscesae]|jgi:type IV pilus assembly protein PilX|uniref:Tfp pilus assembly protein PilX n=1 Tax=endosymbiont of Ridgeia piscesae TaxID=54398 RepID=A0A0T5ZAC5_9GAMM|nr:PilX N-terminal domain-containing pilus assembly protein [endosymbiont of Ridgeia piscesae]KRT55382.1 Tfp pilus assembly protein PilX [endosymbiont of Ridgeia piscesae]KRT59784.1 type IV pilus assembly protein PilX [endosymbiont of Ridgeia piscesae]
MRFQSVIKPHRQQRGAVLVLALMLLVIMTVLGISGIGNSVLEQRMAGNFHQSNTALQAAEVALRVAERWLTTNITSTANLSSFKSGSTGLYSAMRHTVNISPPLQAEDSDRICAGTESGGCRFDPIREEHWCNDASPPTCPLGKGYVTLGQDDLGTGTLPSFDQQVAQQPRFIIEYVGPADVKIDLTMGKVSASTSARQAFRITAIGWGQDRAARQVLQSHVLMPL